jgi:hypothetical protein
MFMDRSYRNTETLLINFPKTDLRQNRREDGFNGSIGQATYLATPAWPQ